MNEMIPQKQNRGNAMARPVKWRRIENIPRYQHFTPTEQTDSVAENVLKLEELEAIRLKDLEGLEQEACATRMAVSRPTFQRILISAREKITDSLINGKAIRIDGGNYTRGICPVRCLDCGRTWQDSIEQMEKEQSDQACPQCRSQNLACCPEDLADTTGVERGCLQTCRRLGRGPGAGGRGRGQGRNRRGPPQGQI
jgi:predicted DNA-binding protein (UPF0251 family)